MPITRARQRREPRRLAYSTRGTLAAGLIIVALAFGVYVNALDNPFVYDDFFTITSNPSITPAADPWFTLVFMPFRPVVNLSYAIDRAIWGYLPFGYHLTNVLMHAAVSLLLFLLLRRMLADARRGDGTPGAQERWCAFFGAALFAVHPIQSETAGYVSARSEILCALFVLGALLLARVAVGEVVTPAEQSPVRVRRAFAAVGAGVCGSLAMLSKEVAVVLPVLFVAYDWLLLPGDQRAKRRRLTRVFLPIALLTLAAAAYRVRSLAGTDAVLSGTPVLNVLTQAIVIWRYLAMMVLPAGQAIVHETRAVTTIADPVALLAAAGLVGLVIAAFRWRHVSPLYPVGAIWWFACIAPSSSIIELKEGMAEHRVYMGSAGVAMVVTALVAGAMWERPLGRGRVRATQAAVLVGLIALCATLTIRRNIVWDSPVSVWREARRVAPEMWEARRALGDALREAGDCPSAIMEYEAVLQHQPRHREALTNLGICLGSSGRLKDAAVAFRRALEIDPAWARSYTNLGAIAIMEGNPERARDYYLQAIAVDGRNVHARMQLARLYEGTFREYERAARLCEEARAIAPATAGAGECIARNQRLAGDAAGGGA